MDALKPLLAQLADGTPLSEADTAQAFDIMMSGAATPAQIGAFLMGLRVHGETVEHITAGARVLREKATHISSPPGAVDTCGTGGDGAGTYNISTAAALVTAACGVPVAKHGNKAASSKSGSAEVLSALGVNIEADTLTVERCLAKAGICFLFAPKHHGAMRHVGPVRGEMGIRTIFNLLGPLSNPAGAKRQLLGVFDDRWLAPMAEVLRNLGSEHVWVVHGSDGLDELTTTGTTAVAELKDGTVRRFTVTPEDAGLPLANADALKGGTPAENAAALRTMLEGEASPYRDIVVLNAAAALIVADKAGDLKTGAALADGAIASGKAHETLHHLIEESHN